MENHKKSSLKMYLQQPFPDRSKPKMKDEEIWWNNLYIDYYYSINYIKKANIAYFLNKSINFAFYSKKLYIYTRWRN